MGSEGIEGKIIEHGDSGHSVDLDGLPTDALRAIIKKLNEKSQRATRVFEDSYNLKIDDIQQLITKVHQEFEDARIVSATTAATVLTTKGRRFDFSTWKEFEEFDSGQPEKTRSLSVSVTIDAIRGQSDVPERYGGDIGSK